MDFKHTKTPRCQAVADELVSELKASVRRGQSLSLEGFLNLFERRLYGYSVTADESSGDGADISRTEVEAAIVCLRRYYLDAQPEFTKQFDGLGRLPERKRK